jgi:acyl-CoA synthetase (AMP-forming)/AMP-acid ligase II
VAAQTIPAVMREAADRFGDLEAIVDGERRMTFAGMLEAVREIERALIGSGVGPGDRVALWAPNGLEWVIISFAVYGVGAVLVPINTRYKGHEAAHLIETAGARLLFTVTDFLGVDYLELLEGALPEGRRPQTIVVSGPAGHGSVPWSTFVQRGNDVGAEEAANRTNGVQVDDPSDIIFTSGTTGLPKGAVLRQGASVETYRQWSRGVGLTRGDRMLVVYPFFHTAGLKSCILASFLVGCTLVTHPVFDVTSVVARVEEERITVLPGPPSVFQSILAHPDFASFPLDTLRLSVTGAAVVPVQLIAQMRTRLGFESVVTAYGLTETHGTATICEQSDPIELIAATVGHPLEGLELRIVDDGGAEQPAESAGEVLVRGFNVMTEYFADPEGTRQAIDPEGWLHTGDVGFLGTDGYLRIIDRKKDIVIVGGFNVSSAEVEAMLLQHEDIAQAAVVAMPDTRLGEVTAAFVVARAERRPDPSEVMRWCRDRMANFKVPRHVEIVTALPLNASGKVLKRELRQRLTAPSKEGS